jgi:dihydroxyacetone kinase
MSSVTIPGRQASESRMGPSEVELGLGIHGEPGAQLVPLRPVSQLAATMVAHVERALETRGVEEGPIAVLVNDLGGVPPIELSVATGALLNAMSWPVALAFGPGRLMTSLDMKGISLTALPLDAEMETALLSEVAPRAWLSGRRPSAVPPLALPAGVRHAEHVPSADASRRAIVQRICEVLVEKQGELDALDAKVGDGDTGTTFATAARAVLADLDRLPFADPPALCAAISDRLSRVMGGSSGILLAIFVAAMGARVGDPPSWPAALRAGVERMMEYGGAKEGDRTMLDALVPAVAALEAGGDLRAAAKAASEGAARTATMKKARAGRSSYVREDALTGVPDPGAIAVAAALEALS